MMECRFAVVACVLAAGLPVGGPAPIAAAAEPAKVVELKVEPAALTLHGPRDARRFVVRGKTEDGSWIDLTRAAQVQVQGEAVRLKDGYVEPVARRGREKPWRLVHRSHEFRGALSEPAGRAALEEMVAFHTEHEFARLRASFHELANDAAPWRDASTISTGAFWATAAELAEVSELLQTFALRFTGRNADPSQRPEGAPS